MVYTDTMAVYIHRYNGSIYTQIQWQYIIYTDTMAVYIQIQWQYIYTDTMAVYIHRYTLNLILTNK